MNFKQLLFGKKTWDVKEKLAFDWYHRSHPVRAQFGCEHVIDAYLAGFARAKIMITQELVKSNPYDLMENHLVLDFVLRLGDELYSGGKPKTS